MAVMAPFTESGLTVRIVDTPEDREQAFRLRHAVYCQRLHWVPPRPDGREHDGYDEGSTTVAVFAADGRILGLVRFIPPGRPFMLESDFCRLLTRFPGTQMIKGVVDPAHGEMLDNGGDSVTPGKAQHMPYRANAAERRARDGFLSGYEPERRDIERL